jgi:hypothetical protein
LEEETLDAETLSLKEGTQHKIRMKLSRAEPSLKRETGHTTSFDMNLGSMNLMKPTPTLKDKLLQEYDSPNFG